MERLHSLSANFLYFRLQDLSFIPSLQPDEVTLNGLEGDVSHYRGLKISKGKSMEDVNKNLRRNGHSIAVVPITKV